MLLLMSTGKEADAQRIEQMFAKRVKVMRTAAVSTTSTVQRHDIGCGITDCVACLRKAHESYAPCLSAAEPIMLPDADVVLHNINVFESPLITNVVFLSTVLAQIHARNKAVHVRLMKVIADPIKKCFVFANDHHESTHCAAKEHEPAADHLARGLRAAAAWFTAHVLQSLGPDAAVTLVTHSEEQLTRTASLPEKVKAGALKDFVVARLGDDCALVELMETRVETVRSNIQCAEHLPLSELQGGVASGAFLKGKLKVSENSCFFGDIRGRFGAFDRVVVGGRANMNRAIHTDVVAVRVLPVAEWRLFGASRSNSSEGLTEEEALKNGYVPAGTVVGILEMNRRPYCGSIGVEDGITASALSGQVSVVFQPKNNKIPRIRMNTKKAAELRDKRITVVIDDWPVNSANPHGHYVEVIGTIGDKDTEAAVILIENDIPHYDFSEAVYDCLPKGAWAVEASEVKRRRDLRHLCVCSVDPLGCRDIDDALHWRKLKNGNVEVGVHIADVTHFLHSGSPMDEEAAKRCTSVYLVDRRINMLPQLLTENLCSIVYGEDRYAFSVLWEFEPESNTVVSEWFGKSIIRSSGALYYGDAQAMIDDAPDVSEMAVSLRGLMAISRILKKERDLKGALTLGANEFKFKMDDSKENPTDMTSYKTFETNSMVEEWMLFANVASAKKVYANFAKLALLRRHQPPADHAFEDLNKALKVKGIPTLNGASSLELNRSLDACVDPSDAQFNKIVRMLTTRCLKQAQYFCSGDVPFDEFNHFGLAMPIYTHFTSPIRRYADVVVHRQLQAIVGDVPLSADQQNIEVMAAVGAMINYRHEQAQKAGRDSTNLFTGFYLRNYKEAKIPDELGYVIRVTDTHVSVLVPKFGQEGKIPVEDLTHSYTVFDKVSVSIAMVKEGDVLSAKLAFGIVEAASADAPVEKKRRVEDGDAPPAEKEYIAAEAGGTASY
jgi:exosome complex exonuclease DIS3/RRP44